MANTPVRPVRGIRQSVPPGVVLAIVVCAYAAPRLREPATKEKIAGLIGKFKRKKRVLESAPPS